MGVVLVAIALRTWVVQGLIVPVTVAGSSMAETLVGPHWRIVCRTCGWAFDVELDAPPSPGRPVVCPRCGARVSDPSSAVWRRGDRLLIDRTTLWHGAPQRWQLVVFRSPEQPRDLVVKRVVGLPGERVRIRAGDIYINGHIARKTLGQQRAMARLVYRAGPLRPQTLPPRWRQDDDQSGWQRQDGAFHHPRRASGAGRSPPICWLRYHHPRGQPIRDNVTYNQRRSRMLHEVADLMLSGLVRGTGPGRLWLVAIDGATRFELEIPNRAGAIRLRRDDRPVARVTVPDGLLSKARRLELSLFDAQVLLALDGQIYLRYPYQRGPKQPGCAEPVALGARRLDIVVRRLTLWRDIYYTSPRWGRRGARQAFPLGPTELFVLGDNSPVSDDSRSWFRGGLPLGLLVGTPMSVQRPESRVQSQQSFQ